MLSIFDLTLIHMVRRCVLPLAAVCRHRRIVIIGLSVQVHTVLPTQVEASHSQIEYNESACHRKRNLLDPHGSCQFSQHAANPSFDKLLASHRPAAALKILPPEVRLLRSMRVPRPPNEHRRVYSLDTCVWNPNKCCRFSTCHCFFVVIRRCVPSQQCADTIR